MGGPARNGSWGGRCPSVLRAPVALAGVLAVLLLVSALPAPRPATDATVASTAPGGASPGGPLAAAAIPPVVLRYGFLQAVDSLNPFRGLSDSSLELYGLMYDYLFSFDQDGNYVPNIALQATCDAVCMNWTYQIRQGVHWNDPQNPTNNGELTAKDVNFTINYDIQDLVRLWKYEPYVDRIVQCPTGQTTGCGAVITSPWNVTVYFDRPYVPGRALFVPIINQTQWQGISATAAESTYTNPDPIGTGPFIADPNIYTEWQNGQPLHLTGNASYHGGAPHLTDVYFQQYSDENSLVAALEANPPAVDLAKFTPYGYNAVGGQPYIARQEGLTSTQYSNEVGITQLDSLAADTALNPARFDLHVRQALAMATNKDDILQSIYLGAGMRGSSIMSPITPQWWLDPTTVPGLNLTFSIQAANALLNRSGYTGWTGGTFGSGIRFNPNPINVFVQTNAAPSGTTKTIPAGTQLTFTMAVRQEFVQEQDTANYLKSEWARIGVNIVYKVELESALTVDVYRGNVEMYIWYRSGDPDPNHLLSFESGYTLGSFNDNYWDNSSYNANYTDQLSSFDSTQRQAEVRAAEAVHYNSSVYIIYIYPYGEWAYRTDTLSGWGDWNAHPYRQVNAFWGANPLFLELTAGQGNHCPSTPVIQGTPPISVFTGQNVTFVGNSTDIDAGQTLNWTWNWDDQTTNVSQTTTASTSNTAVHAWTQVGTYHVVLNVSDGYCQVNSSAFEVDVVARSWIGGTVMDGASGGPVAGAAVSAASLQGFQQASSSDALGRFNLTVEVGTYAMTVSHIGYSGLSYSGVVTSANRATTLSLYLMPMVNPISLQLASALGRAGHSMTLMGNVTAPGPGTWNLDFGDGSNATGSHGAGTTSIAVAHTYASQGNYAVHLMATSVLLNASVDSVAVVDGTPPVTTLVILGTQGSGGWYTSPVNVTLTAVDPVSGVAAILYRLDGDSVRNYSGPIVISTEGEHVLAYYAVDGVGNVETAWTRFIDLDLAPPRVRVVSPSEGATVPSGHVLVSWAGMDNASGIAAYQASVDGGPLQDMGTNLSFTFGFPDGLHTVTVWAEDAAGHRASTSVAFRIDTNPFSPSGPYAGTPTYVIVAVAVVLAILFLLRRYRRGTKDVAPPPQTPPSVPP